TSLWLTSFCDIKKSNSFSKSSVVFKNKGVTSVSSSLLIIFRLKSHCHTLNSWYSGCDLGIAFRYSFFSVRFPFLSFALKIRYSKVQLLIDDFWLRNGR